MELSKWDAAEYIRTDEDARLLLEEAAKDGDAGDIAAAIGEVARAYGLEARRAGGIPIEQIYGALGKHPAPDRAQLLGILEALGIPSAAVKSAAE